MKKSIKKVALLSLIILYFSIGKSFASTGVVIIPAARLREKPNTESEIITNIYEDDKVKVLETNGDWCKIEYDGNTGYVKKEFLKIKEEKTNTNQGNTTQEKTNTNKGNTIRENTNTVNTENNISNTTRENNVQNTTNENNQNSNQSAKISLRVLPNITSKIITELDKTKTINQIAEINNWVKVTDGTITGWVIKEKLIKNETPTEDNQSQPTTNEQETKPEDKKEEPKQEQPKEEEPKEETNVNKTGKINVETAIVREKASSDAKISEFLDYNDEVTIVSEDGDWYKIEKGSIKGYVNKRLVTLNTISSRSLPESRENSKEDDTTVNEAANNSVNNALSNSETTLVSKGTEIVEFAKQYLGCSYVLGGKTPESGFDCSGFTKYVYSNFGYTLGNTAATQNNIGTESNVENLKPGDLILFYDEGKTKIGHTGIYMGDGNFIHAANSSRGVVTDNLNTNSYYNTRVVSIRRIAE